MVNSTEGTLDSSKKQTLIFVTENEFSTSTKESLICVKRLSSFTEETLNNNVKDETLSDSSKKVTIAHDPLDLMIVPDQNITLHQPKHYNVLQKANCLKVFLHLCYI